VLHLSTPRQTQRATPASQLVNGISTNVQSCHCPVPWPDLLSDPLPHDCRLMWHGFVESNLVRSGLTWKYEIAERMWPGASGI
jgi:hypothetical protein